MKDTKCRSKAEYSRPAGALKPYCCYNQSRNQAQATIHGVLIDQQNLSSKQRAVGPAGLVGFVQPVPRLLLLGPVQQNRSTALDGFKPGDACSTYPDDWECSDCRRVHWPCSAPRFGMMTEAGLLSRIYKSTGNRL